MFTYASLHLQSSGSRFQDDFPIDYWQTENLDLSTFVGDTNFEQSVFEKLLQATYMRRYTIRSLDELLALTKRADYYQMLPVVSYSLLGALHRCYDPISVMLENPRAAFEAAIKLKSPELYKDCFIMLLGPMHAPTYQKEEKRFDDYNTFLALEHAFHKIQAHMFQVINWSVNEIHDQEETWINRLKSQWQQRVDESLEEFDMVY
jgi:hypothetical protein